MCGHAYTKYIYDYYSHISITAHTDAKAARGNYKHPLGVDFEILRFGPFDGAQCCFVK